jgi:hypothetical protein
MANLSAPTVSEPIYECAAGVVVVGYVPGANVTIIAKPPGANVAMQVGGGVSNSAGGQVFGVATVNMVAGASITAVTSPSSPEVVVQSALNVDAPRLMTPLLEHARCVHVGGLLPGVTVEVRDAGTLIGRSLSADAGVHVDVYPPLASGHTIKARQVYCGNPGPESPGIAVTPTTVERTIPLGTPELAYPLFACQPTCIVFGCVPGCDVELFVDGVPVGSSCSDSTGMAFEVAGGLVPGTTITARQGLRSGRIWSEMSAGVVVQPAANIPKPAICPPLYAGDTAVMVGMTVAGEVVTIAADGAKIGMGGSGGGGVILNVDPPLVAGQKVFATVELCAVKKRSRPVLVRSAPESVQAPKVVEPLIACCPYVEVSDCIPGAEVRVFARTGGNIVLLGVTKTLGAAATVGITPPLENGWSVFATQKAGGELVKALRPEP